MDKEDINNIFPELFYSLDCSRFAKLFCYKKSRLKTKLCFDLAIFNFIANIYICAIFL